MRVSLSGRATDQRGFTLPELLATILIMGILAAIAIPSWFGVTESRRVESAANQTMTDLRNANSTASNRLSTWAIVLAPNRGAPSAGPDYYLTKLTSSGAVDATVSPAPRYLPDNVKVINDPSLNDTALVTAVYSAAAGFVGPPSTTRTLKFQPDGSMQASGDTIKVTEDGSPTGKVTFFVTTSKVGSEIVP